MICRRSGALFAALAAVFLTACVSTEPLSEAPHINLSPETMSFEEAEQRGQVDFGLRVTTNESDSLENLAVLPGLRVRSVRNGSVAELAGLRAGDVILSINGVETNQVDVLDALAHSEAQRFEMRVRRDTTVYETTMDAPRQRQAARPKALYRVDPIRSRAGYSTHLVDTESGQRTVARIENLYPDSPLAAQGLREGDLILSLDRENIQSAQDLVNKLHRRQLGERVNLALIAQSEPGQVQNVSLRLWEPARRLNALSLWPLFRYESSLSPEQVEFKLLDLILFPVFSYQREEGEKTYRLLGLFKFGTGYGELLEEDSATRAR